MRNEKIFDALNEIKSTYPELTQKQKHPKKPNEFHVKVEQNPDGTFSLINVVTGKYLHTSQSQKEFEPAINWLDEKLTEKFESNKD